MKNKPHLEDPQRAPDKSWAEMREERGLPMPTDGRSLRSDVREQVAKSASTQGSVNQEAVRPSRRVKGFQGSRFK
ncbi:hypothetical protein EXS71_00430 [Candidatus Uhrbacteria bacterium]|nr:hypothetical protein [Candidatus Uhrbacteria bacterium]